MGLLKTTNTGRIVQLQGEEPFVEDSHSHGQRIPLADHHHWLLAPRSIVIDFGNQVPNFFDYLIPHGPVYDDRMKTQMKCFKRSFWCLFVVEGLCAVLWIVASNNSVVAFNLLPFLLLSALVNLPGWGLARGLGLLGPNGFLDPHPVAGAVLAFVVGTLCWVALLWSISGCFDKDVPI